MKNKIIAILDINNFYCSAERVFRPDLWNKPVLVASNNDGAVVARSAEVKALGIAMGTPLFKIRELVREHNITVFSSNYALYNLLSNRVMAILAEYSPIQEIYSIDEQFSDLTGFDDVVERAKKMREHILRDTNLPCCIGTGPSKTIAKLMNFTSKRHPKSKGVLHYHLLTEKQVDSIFSNIPTDEVWGIGRRLHSSLLEMGIETVKQLRDADITLMREKFGVVMEKTVRELRGECCIEIEEITAPKQQIITSRSFGQPVSTIEELRGAIAHFVANCARKLREQNSIAAMIQIFIMTDRFRKDREQYCPSICIPLVSPTSNAIRLQNAADIGLKHIFREGFLYKKAGVMVSDICDATFHQGDLFTSDDQDTNLMMVMDELNRKYGKGTLRISMDGSTNSWAMKQQNKSPNYLCEWDELPICYA